MGSEYAPPRPANPIYLTVFYLGGLGELGPPEQIVDEVDRNDAGRMIHAMEWLRTCYHHAAEVRERLRFRVDKRRVAWWARGLEFRLRELVRESTED
jgi:hypothetical protein